MHLRWNWLDHRYYSIYSVIWLMFLNYVFLFIVKRHAYLWNVNNKRGKLLTMVLYELQLWQQCIPTQNISHVFHFLSCPVGSISFLECWSTFHYLSTHKSDLNHIFTFSFISHNLIRSFHCKKKKDLKIILPFSNKFQFNQWGL